MTAREKLDEMKQFMNIARGDLQKEKINEVYTIELGGQQHPQRRVPIEFYDEFKAKFPGSIVRFRGLRYGRDNTRKADATHFYIVRIGRPDRASGQGLGDDPVSDLPYEPPTDRPHTPGYNKQGSAGRAAADSRAQAFIFDDVNDDYDDYDYEEEDEWAEHFEMKDAEKEKFKGKTIIVTDLYDGDVYGIFNKKRFMISSPLDRGWGVGEVSDDEIEVADLDYSLSPKEEDFLRAWHRSHIDESVNEDLDPEGMGYYDVTVETDNTSYPSEIQTAIPYDEAISFAQEYVKNNFAFRAERVEKWKRNDGVEWNGLDRNGDSFFVRVLPSEDADVEAWYGESIELDSVVENVLEEFPGQPKDYVDPEDNFDPYDDADQREMADDMDNDYNDAEEEELGLRFD